MSSGQGRETVYSAAEVREFLADDLKGKENRWIREFAGLIDDERLLDWLNMYASIYEERGEDFLETRVARHVIRSAATKTTDSAFREGNISQLKGAVGLTNQSKDGSEAVVEAARRLSDEGAIYLILGPPGAGKTAFALDVIRTWGALTGGRILSNVDWEGADRHADTSREMLEGMASVDGQVLQFIDEAGQSLTSKGAEQQVSDHFAKSLKYVRKKEAGDAYAKRGSVLLIGHTRKDTAAEIRRLASGAFVKPSRRDPGRVEFYESDGSADGLEKIEEFRGVTDTRETYDEHEASSFTVIEEDSADDVDREDVARAAEDAQRQQAVATVVRACKPWSDDDGMSYASAADLVDYSNSWVGDRVREWEAGDHRELVAAPNGGSA